MTVIFVRFIAKETRTACLNANNEIVPLKNLNKCLYNDENETETNVSNISEKFALKSQRISES
jgi:hypothetical protein